MEMAIAIKKQCFDSDDEECHVETIAKAEENFHELKQGDTI